MKTAFNFGIIGLAASIFCGTYFLNLSISEIGQCVFISNLAAFFSLFSILEIQHYAFTKKNIRINSLHSWSLLLFFYFSILYALAPPIRNLTTILTLIFPLIFCAGFSLILFGPIRDFMIKKRQKKILPQKRKDTLDYFPSDSAML